MYSDFYQTLSMIATQIFLGIYVVTLMELRQPKRVWFPRWITIAVGLVALQVALIALVGFKTFSQYQMLTLVAPYTLGTVWCSRYRKMCTVFSVANGAYVGCVGALNGFVAQVIFPAVPFLSLWVRIVSMVLLYLVLKRFGQTYRQMMRQLDSGWTLICLIPITTSELTLYIYHAYFYTDPFPASVSIYGLLILCGCAYYLMYLFFERVARENEAQRSAHLSALQLSALQSRMDAVRATEDTIRTERHDLRHRLQIAAELVTQGDKTAALDFLSAAQRKLDEQKQMHWCRPPVLDAVFTSYFEQAKRQEIQVKAKLSLPSTLPVEESELAIVLANALENAICANMKLPSERREIDCRIVSAPSLMLEISNPCDEKVTFDEQGIPVSQRQGHGLGMQSISHFCRKHGAVCQFEQTHGRFQMRLIL